MNLPLEHRPGLAGSHRKLLSVASLLVVLAIALVLWMRPSDPRGTKAIVGQAPASDLPAKQRVAREPAEPVSREPLNTHTADGSGEQPVAAVATEERSEEVVPAVCVPFDGYSLDGWTAVGNWSVKDGVIEYAGGTAIDETLECSKPIAWPCEISMEVQLVGRNPEDARGFWLKGGDEEIHVRIDNSPNEFQLKVPEEAPQSAEYPLTESRWYELRCRVQEDGVVRAWIDGTNELRATWVGEFPFKLGLECQRSGGRYRSIVVTKLDGG